MVGAFVRYLLHAALPRRDEDDWETVLRQRVLNDRRHYYRFDEIEDLRSQLLRDQRMVSAAGWGAGSRSGRDRMCVADLVRCSALPPRYARLLFRLALHLHCRHILELGTSLGLTTLYLAAAPAARVFTVEGNAALAALARENFQQLGAENICLMESSFADALKKVFADLSGADLVFLDGDHRFAAVQHYFQLLLPHLHERSVLIVDDINWSTEMRKAWREMQRHPRVTMSFDLYRLGLLFFLNRTKPVHRAVWY